VDAGSHIHIEPAWIGLFREAGLATLDGWLSDPRVKVWRDIRERQNGILELGGHRFHVKRLRPPGGREVEAEISGIRLLEAAGIPTVSAAAWGCNDQGAGVLVSVDLAGFCPADQLMAEGAGFGRFAEPTADLAARLHRSGLHHRDLYLCHFMFNDAGECRLIDAARVRRLPWLTRRRWITKDLAQFRYSALEAGAKQLDLDEWLGRWAAQMRASAASWHSAVARKSAAIARHDRSLARRSPERYRSLKP
jgi:hypothetical protein